MILWEDRYKTGEEMIDRQHRMLFEFFNDFEDVIKNGLGKSFVENSLLFLENYIHLHFGIEEFCMHKHRCPIADKNKAAHEKFKETFNTYKNKLADNGYNDQIATELHQNIEAWI